MPLNPSKLKTGLTEWYKNTPPNKIQAASKFLEHYIDYSRDATIGGIPISLPPALDAARETAKPLIIAGLNGVVLPVWVSAIYGALTAYWNTAIASQAFGPTVVPPVVTLPEPLMSSLLAAGAAGMGGADSSTIASMSAVALDLWTRTVTGVLAGVVTPIL